MVQTVHPPGSASELQNCLTDEQLHNLVHHRGNPRELEQLTRHLDHCLICQGKLENLATGEHRTLSQIIRGIDRLTPPRNSALWRAMDDAVALPLVSDASLTVATKITPPIDVKLDFLQPSDYPGALGRLNRFEVLRVIGRGGMGIVFQAYDPSLQREIAIKVLDPQLQTNENYRQRFCREARSAASVSHENIVAVHQVETDDPSGLPYFVMQLVVGESLEQRLRRVGKLSIAEVIRLGAQASAGLAAAHATGLIHRDVKPGNMLLEAGTDRVKLTDFGLARAHEDLRLTKTGFVSGTPLYMAPEQARGDDIDQRADLFSLGVVLYEAMTGQPPFDGKTPLAVLRRVADEPHKPLSEVLPDIPEWFEDVIDRLLTKDPAKRFHSSAEVAEILGQHLPKYIPAEHDATAPNLCTLSAARSNLSRTARRRLQFKLALMMMLPLLFGIGLGIGVSRLANPRAGTTPINPVIPREEMALTEDFSPLAKQNFAGNSGAALSVAVCPDGRSLAMGLEDGRILIYDIIDKKVNATLNAHLGPIWGIDFFKEVPGQPKRFVSASEDGTVNIWELGNSKPIKSLPHESAVRALALQKDQKWVATGDRAGTVYMWNLQLDIPVKRIQHGSSVNAVAFTSDGLSIITAGSNKTVNVWNATTGERRYTLEGHRGPVYSVATSNDVENPLTVTAGWDNIIRVWDDQGTLLNELKGHNSDVWSLSFCNLNCMLASAGEDGTIRVWDIKTGKQVDMIRAHKPVATVVRFTHDNLSLISGGRDGYVRLWDLPKK